MAKDRVKALVNQPQGKIKDGIHVVEDDRVEDRLKSRVKNAPAGMKVALKK
jgi:hypothetical protein